MSPPILKPTLSGSLVAGAFLAQAYITWLFLQTPWWPHSLQTEFSAGQRPSKGTGELKTGRRGAGGGGDKGQGRIQEAGGRRQGQGQGQGHGKAGAPGPRV